MLRRSTNSSGTTLTVYAFGLEEHQYNGSGTNQGNTYYYSLAGRLLGSLDSNGTVFYMTDLLGSVLASFSNVASSATLKGEQSFTPYGTAQYSQGSINTAKGFTGQYNDALTGLDYYGARYYDPAVGVFLSADSVQGNGAGMNPYAYVGGNPETWSDPTGQAVVSSCFATCGGKEYYPVPTISFLSTALQALLGGSGSSTPLPLSSGQSLTNSATGACLVAGCHAGIFADSGSSWMQGPPISTCLAMLTGGCVTVLQPISYRVNNPPIPMSYCTPPYGCGEGGSGESQAENTKVNDALWWANAADELGLGTGSQAEPAASQGPVEPAAGQPAGANELNLAAEESYGGHTIARHIDVTEEFVRIRAAIRGGDASAFYSLSDATESIQYIMDNSIPQMQGTGRIFEGAFTRDIGYVYDFYGNRVEANLLRVVQRPLDSDWFILTAFPIV